MIIVSPAFEFHFVEFCWTFGFVTVDTHYCCRVTIHAEWILENVSVFGIEFFWTLSFVTADAHYGSHLTPQAACFFSKVSIFLPCRQLVWVERRTLQMRLALYALDEGVACVVHVVAVVLGHRCTNLFLGDS